MTWREQRLREIDVRARRYERELESEWVRAVAAFRGFRANGGGSIAVEKGRLVRREDPVVERYPDKFEKLDPRMVANRVRSLTLRLRSQWGVE